MSADVAGNVNITGSASGPRVVKGLSTGSLVGKDLIPASPPENFCVCTQFLTFFYVGTAGTQGLADLTGTAMGL